MRTVASARSAASCAVEGRTVSFGELASGAVSDFPPTEAVLFDSSILRAIAIAISSSSFPTNDESGVGVGAGVAEGTFA